MYFKIINRRCFVQVKEACLQSKMMDVMMNKETSDVLDWQQQGVFD